MARTSMFRNIDGQVLFLLITLIIIGLVNIFSSEYNQVNYKFLSMDSNFTKQLIFLGAVFLVFIFILAVEVRFFINFSFFIYFFIIALLLFTFIFGKVVSGTRAWISIGDFNLQASELAKFATTLALAKYIDYYRFRMDNLRDRMIVFGIILLPVAIIILQNDFGSALVFTSFILLLYRQGLPSWMLYLPLLLCGLFIIVLLLGIYWTGAIVIGIALLFYAFTYRKKKVLAFLLAITIATLGFVFSVNYIFENVLQNHQRTRVLVLLGKEVDLKGSGYNVHQSLIAVGSGGFTGKGFLKGTQTKLNFVPEQSTDFIFCTIAEEYGFIGSLILVILFAWLIIRILLLAEKQKYRYARVYGYGVASILFFHFTLNIAMTLGIFPVIGIPLPFISYGGSSLLGFVILVTLFLKLDADYKHYFN